MNFFLSQKSHTLSQKSRFRIRKADFATEKPFLSRNAHKNRREENKRNMKPTRKQAKVLFSMRPLSVNEKLWKGSFDTFRIDEIDDRTVTIEFSKSGEPGYSIRTYSRSTYDGVLGTFINSPIVNRSGLATVIWNDKDPNVLRRRLQQKIEHCTLTPEELELLYDEAKKLSEQLRRSLHAAKSISSAKSK